MQYKIPVTVITSAVVVAILVATPGIIVSSQIAFGVAGGTQPGAPSGQPTSNVGGQGTTTTNAPPKTVTLTSGQTGKSRPTAKVCVTVRVPW